MNNLRLRTVYIFVIAGLTRNPQIERALWIASLRLQ
jgi:hypothetical protein